MKSLSNNCKSIEFDERLLKWSLKNNRHLTYGQYKDWGPYHVPCGNDCGKAITINDIVVVAYNKKGHVRGVFCSEQCQRQYLLTIMIRRKK